MHVCRHMHIHMRACTYAFSFFCSIDITREEERGRDVERERGRGKLGSRKRERERERNREGEDAKVTAEIAPAEKEMRTARFVCCVPELFFGWRRLRRVGQIFALRCRVDADGARLDFLVVCDKKRMFLCHTLRPYMNTAPACRQAGCDDTVAHVAGSIVINLASSSWAFAPAWFSSPSLQALENWVLVLGQDARNRIFTVIIRCSMLSRLQRLPYSIARLPDWPIARTTWSGKHVMRNFAYDWFNVLIVWFHPMPDYVCELCMLTCPNLWLILCTIARRCLLICRLMCTHV